MSLLFWQALSGRIWSCEVYLILAVIDLLLTTDRANMYLLKQREVTTMVVHFEVENRKELVKGS